jgi:hypothetical protein
MCTSVAIIPDCSKSAEDVYMAAFKSMLRGRNPHIEGEWEASYSSNVGRRPSTFRQQCLATFMTLAAALQSMNAEQPLQWASMPKSCISQTPVHPSDKYIQSTFDPKYLISHVRSG